MRIASDATRLRWWLLPAKTTPSPARSLRPASWPVRPSNFAASNARSLRHRAGLDRGAATVRRAVDSCREWHPPAACTARIRAGFQLPPWLPPKLALVTTTKKNGAGTVTNKKPRQSGVSGVLRDVVGLRIGGRRTIYLPAVSAAAKPF